MKFENRSHHVRSETHEVVLDCLEAGIDAARPETVVESTIDVRDDTLHIDGDAYDLTQFERVLVLGGGKASHGLAAGLESRLGDRLDGGIVVTTGETSLDRVSIHQGDHPTPSTRNVEAAEQILSRASQADEQTLVLALITGGASALLCAPAGDLTLSSLQETTEALLESGAAIDEINAVRKHCSALKGGQLARTAAPATVVTLAISDVVGDDPSVIGSGPTVPDSTTFGDALDVIDRYELGANLPAAVLEHLRQGADGTIPETPGTDDPIFERTNWHVLANGETALAAAAAVAESHGYEPLVLSGRISGEAREAGRFHAAIGAEMRASGRPVEPPAVVLSGGEVTVTVRGDGTGGPNQELALASGLAFATADTEAVLGSVDTDGIDGPTDAAGGLVDHETVTDADAAREALATSDVTPHLTDLNALLKMGYTGTNVNDLRALAVTEQSEP